MMRIFTKKKAKVKSSLKEDIKQNSEVFSEPEVTLCGILKPKKSKSKAKMEESLKETLLEWLEKMVNSQASGKSKPGGVKMVKLIMDKLREKGKLRKNSTHEAGGKEKGIKD